MHHSSGIVSVGRCDRLGSYKHKVTRSACSENSAKLTPPWRGVAPRGWCVPGDTFLGIVRKAWKATRKDCGHPSIAVFRRIAGRDGHVPCPVIQAIEDSILTALLRTARIVEED